MVRAASTIGFICCVVGLAPCRAAEPTLVAPAVTWDGVAHRDTPAAGPHEVKVLATAEAFRERWKVWRPGEKAPAVNFTDYFAVEVVQPGGQYSLLGLRVDEAGAARVNGIGILQQVGVPKGYGHTFAVFPRRGVKMVEGRELPAPK
ncbi:MAG: hypothetical protein IT429_07415 [Gemmataceae bacterium]|nr:hypothetical protein [Gemmataceae bacterium]